MLLIKRKQLTACALLILSGAGSRSGRQIVAGPGQRFRGPAWPCMRLAGARRGVKKGE